MSSEFLKELGQIAGIGGIAIGVLLLIFKDLIHKTIFPKMTKAQAFRFLLTIALLTWSIAILGIISWTYIKINVNTTGMTNASKEDIDKTVRLLRTMIYLDAGQAPISMYLSEHCRNNDTAPSPKLLQYSEILLKEAIPVFLQQLDKDEYSMFLIEKFDTFRQLRLDLETRIQVLETIVSVKTNDPPEKFDPCELSRKYWEVHRRLHRIEKEYHEYVRSRYQDQKEIVQILDDY